MCKNVKDLSIFIQATIPPRGIEILWTKHSTSVGNPLINSRSLFASLSNYDNQSESPSMLKQESDMKFIHFNKLMVTG